MILNKCRHEMMRSRRNGEANTNHENNILGLHISMRQKRWVDRDKGCHEKYEDKESMWFDSILIEIWKYPREIGVGWLTKLFNDILISGRMPNAWRNYLNSDI